MEFNRCSKCGLALIQEEVISHECKSVIDYRFEDDILWMFDGKIWYPRKLTNRNFTSKKSTADYTEPPNNIFITY